MREVIAAATASGSMFAVSNDTSAKTMVAPNNAAVACVAMNVIGGVITSSPGFSPIAAYAQCSAAVPELTEIQGALTSFSRCDSNASTRGPVVSQSLLRAATTDAMSSSLIEWRP